MRAQSRRRVALRIWASVLALLIIFFGSAERAAAWDPDAPRGTPKAHVVHGNATVGPLFPDGLSSDYICSASVIASPTHDLILTAGHCLSGNVSGWQFAPAYEHGRTPYGVWTVQHAYLPTAWLRYQNPQDDFAILQLAKKKIHGHWEGVQDLTGANGLGRAPRAGATITDIAYNSGSDGRPISCTTRSYRTGDYPAFNCRGYVGGSSGSPWLATVRGSRQLVVRGVIGGLHQGGCYDYTSYSSNFGAVVHHLLGRAVHRRHPDSDAPGSGGDGC